MQAQKHAAPASSSRGPQTHEPETAPLLPDPKHEAFAQAISLGEEPAPACRKIYRCKTAATAEARGASLLADPAIAARITTLQREASHIAVHQAHFDKAQLIAFLVETIQTPVSTVDQHHRQCQEWTRDELTTTRRTTATTSPQQKTQSHTPASATPSNPSRRQLPSTKSTSYTQSITESAPSPQDPAPPPPILIRSKTKLPSKLDAAKLLATLCGWHAPSKVEGKVNLGISPTVEDALSQLLR